MAEIDQVRDHFTRMARGEIPYTSGFRVIRNASPPPKAIGVHASPMIAISPAQAAIEQSQSLIGSGGRQMLTAFAPKSYKKRTASSKPKKTSAKRGRRSSPREAF